MAYNPRAFEEELERLYQFPVNVGLSSMREPKPGLFKRTLSGIGSVLHYPKSVVDAATNYYSNEVLRRRMLSGEEPIPAEELAAGALFPAEEAKGSFAKSAGRAVSRFGFGLATDPLIAGLGTVGVIRGAIPRVAARLGARVSTIPRVVEGAVVGTEPGIRIGASAAEVLPKAIQPAVRRGLSGYFATTMGMGALEQAREASRLAGEEGFTPPVLEHGLGAAGSAVFAAGAAGHAIGRGRRPVQQPAKDAWSQAEDRAAQDVAGDQQELPEVWEGPPPVGFGEGPRPAIDQAAVLADLARPSGERWQRELELQEQEAAAAELPEDPLYTEALRQRIESRAAEIEPLERQGIPSARTPPGRAVAEEAGEAAREAAIKQGEARARALVLPEGMGRERVDLERLRQEVADALPGARPGGFESALGEMLQESAARPPGGPRLVAAQPKPRPDDAEAWISNEGIARQTAQGTPPIPVDAVWDNYVRWKDAMSPGVEPSRVEFEEVLASISPRWKRTEQGFVANIPRRSTVRPEAAAVAPEAARSARYLPTDDLGPAQRSEAERVAQEAALDGQALPGDLGGLEGHRASIEKLRGELADDYETGRAALQQRQKLYGKEAARLPDGVHRLRSRPSVLVVQVAGGRIIGFGEAIHGKTAFITGGRAAGSPVSARPLYEYMRERFAPDDVVTAAGELARRKRLQEIEHGEVGSRPGGRGLADKAAAPEAPAGSMGAGEAEGVRGPLQPAAAGVAGAEGRREPVPAKPEELKPPKPGEASLDELGNPILPGETHLTPEARAMVRESAKAIVKDAIRASEGRPGRRVTSGERNEFIAAYGQPGGTRGSVLEGTGRSAKEMLKALDRDKGNPLEIEIHDRVRQDERVVDELDRMGEASQAPSLSVGRARPLPGQQGLFGGEVPAEKPARKEPEQRALFGAREMLVPTERRGTEGREAEGPLFTEEAEARLRAEREAQQTIPGVAAKPAEARPALYLRAQGFGPDRKPSQVAVFYDEPSGQRAHLIAARMEGGKIVDPEGRVAEYLAGQGSSIAEAEAAASKLSGKTPEVSFSTGEAAIGQPTPETAEPVLSVPVLPVARQRFQKIGRVAEQPDGSLLVRFYDGKSDLVIHSVDRIEYDPRELKAGRPEGLQPGQVVLGSHHFINGRSVVRLLEGRPSEGAALETVVHEEVHGLLPKDVHGILAGSRMRQREVDRLFEEHGYRAGDYPNYEERQAAFLQASEKVADTVGRLARERMEAERRGEKITQPPWFERVWQFLKTLWEAFRGYPSDTAASAKERIVSGKVYQQPRLLERGAAAAGEGLRGAGRAVSEGAVVAASFAASKTGPVFFSRLRQAVDRFPQAKATSEQIGAWLRKQPGVKADEMKWTGLDEFLKSKRGFTKQELQEFLAANQVEVKEVEKGGSKEGQRYAELDEKLRMLGEEEERADRVFKAASDELQHASPATWADLRDDFEGIIDASTEAEFFAEHKDAPIELTRKYISTNNELYRAADARTEIRRELRDAPANVYTPKFAQWQLPGGENYRELLLTLPSRIRPSRRITLEEVRQRDPQLADNLLEDISNASDRRLSATEIDNEVNNAFWRERDAQVIPLETAEALERAFPEARSEAQRHAASMRQDFRSSHWEEPNVLAHVRFNEREGPNGERVLFVEEIQSDWHQAGQKRGYRATPKEISRLSEEYRRAREKEREAFARYREQPNDETSAAAYDSAESKLGQAQRALDKAASGIPQAPLAKNWHELAFRRMARYAAENGFDRLAWIGGKETAGRYDLSRHIDSLQWDLDRNRDGYEVVKLVGTKDGSVALETWVDRTNLDASVGKDAAAKIAESIAAGEPGGELRGLDLKIGGEWASNLYDRMIPQYAKEFGKKWGAGVEAVSLGAGEGGLDALSVPITRPMRESIVAEGVPLFAVGEARPARPEVRSGVLPPREEEWADFLIRQMQDKFVHVKRAVESVKAHGGKVAEETDPYAAIERFQSVTAENLRDMEREYAEPIGKGLAKANVTYDHLSDYLSLRHVPQADAVLLERTGMEHGSGWRPDEVAAQWKLLEKTYGERDSQGRIAALEPVADMVRNAREKTLEVMQEGGLVSADTVKEWRERWGEDYVPFRTQQVEDLPAGPSEFDVRGGDLGVVPGDGGGGAAPSIGTGFDIRGPESKARLGRGTRSDNVVTFTLAQLQRAVVRAEKNKADNTLAQFMKDNPSPEWGIDEKHTTAVLGKDGKREIIPDRRAYDDDIHYKTDGVEHRITVRHPLLNRALKNVSAHETGEFLRKAAYFTRLYSQLVTSWSPDFLGTNPARDIQTALANVGVEQGGKVAAKIPKYVGPALKGLWRTLRNPKADGKWEDYAREFREDGGAVGFYFLRGVPELEKQMQWRVKSAGPGAVKAGLRALIGIKDLVEDLNRTLENGTRLAVYAAMREAGASRQKSGHTARNATIDFTKKGEAGAALNSLYAFFNASAQGTKRLVDVLRTPRGMAVAGSIAATGWALDQRNRVVAEDSDDDGLNDWDAIPEFIKERNWIWMRGKGERPIMFPMPYGFNLLLNAGRLAGATTSGVMTPEKAAASMGSATLNVFNPLGGEESAIQSLTPTMLDPVVQHEMNKDFTGRAIRPEKYPGQAKPDSELYFRNVPPLARDIAKWLNSTTGGDEVTPGYISVSPETIDHFYKFLGGGLGRFGSNVATTVQALAEGKEVSARNLPVARRFIYEAHPGETSMRFWENRRELDELYSRAKHYQTTGQREKLRGIPRGMLRAKRYLDHIERRIVAIRKAGGPLAEKKAEELQREANRVMAKARKKAA